MSNECMGLSDFTQAITYTIVWTLSFAVLRRRPCDWQ